MRSLGSEQRKGKERATTVIGRDKKQCGRTMEQRERCREKTTDEKGKILYRKTGEDKLYLQETQICEMRPMKV